MSVTTHVDEDEQAQLDPLSAQRAMRTSMVAAGVVGVFFAGTTGALINGFALRLGADNFHIGLLGAIPLFAFTAQILGAYLTERIRERKTMWLVTAALHRLLWVPILLIPHLFGWTSSSTQLKLLLVLVLASSLFGSTAAPAWFSWMADVVPDKQAGRFWGPRSAVLTLAVFAVGIPFSIIMDHFSVRPVIGYTLVFSISVVFGVYDVYMHKWIKHPPMAPKAKPRDFRQLLFKPFRNTEFRQFLLLTCLWNIAVQMFVPFIMVYFLRDLKMTFLQISLLNTLFGVSLLAFSRFWGYIIDHFGKQPVIELLLMLKFLIPGAYLLTNPDFFWPVLIPTYIFDGFLCAGLNPAFQAASLSYSPREDKSMFIAMYQATMGFVSAIGPLSMGFVMRLVPEFRFDFGPIHWQVIHLAFLGSVIARLFLWPLGRRLSEPGAASAATVLRGFMDSNPFRTIYHLRILDVSSDVGQRTRSARALQRKPGSMAVEPLIEALGDPDREVRAAAALALGEIGCPQSVQALIRALKSPYLDIQQPAARSLGALGTSECIEALIEVLNSTEDATLRGHVARVLGQTQNSQAVPPLLSLFRTDHATGVLASAAEALSHLGEIKALRAILPQMRQIEEPVVQAQMAVAVANLLGVDGEFYGILAEERRTPGLAVARLQAQALEDLKALKKHGIPKNAQRALKKVSAAYLAGDFSESCRVCRTVCCEILDLPTEADDAEEGTEYIDQMRLFLLAQPKLGIQLWFLLVMGSREWAQQGPIGMEIALVAHYTLVKITSTLRDHPGLLDITPKQSNHLSDRADDPE